MALRFIDVVEELKEKVPELREAPVMCGSPLAMVAGPCFMPVTGEEYLRQVWLIWRIMKPAVESEYAEWYRQVKGLPVGIHLPEEADLHKVYMAQAEFLCWLVCSSDEEREAAMKQASETIQYEVGFLADMLRNAGFDVTEKVMAQFVVLHELGHYLDWLNAPDKQWWIAKAMSANADFVRSDATIDEYRKLEHEAKADAFALGVLKRLYGKGGDR